MQYLRQFLKESSTLEYHSELNPKFWVNVFLKEDVRNHLLEIAKEWLKFSETPSSAVTDIVLTGGNANFNYTDNSDLDIHIILNPRKIPKCNDETYFKDKKLIWSLMHSISIYGTSVEVYAQVGEIDIPKNQGVFSLKTNKWVVKPENLNINFEKDPLLDKKIKDAIYEIEHALNSATDNTVIDKILNKYKKMRETAIRSGGEFTQENLVFKELRNLGYIDKIRNFTITMLDKKLSLN